MTYFLYDEQTMSLAKLKQSLKKLRKHEKYGFYIDAVELDNDEYHVRLYGPSMHWTLVPSWRLDTLY